MTTKQFIEECFVEATKEMALDHDSFCKGAEYIINHLIKMGKL